MSTTRTSPGGLRRLLVGLGGGLALTVGLAGPAAATNEFPANPEATIEAVCDPGGKLAYTLTNVGGLSTAYFQTEHKFPGGGGGIAHEVLPDQTYSHAEYSPEGAEATLTITAEGMAPVTLTNVADCYDDPSVTITPKCTALGFALDYDFTTDGPEEVAWAVTTNDVTKELGPNVGMYSAGTLVEGESYDVSVTANGTVVETLTGDADCVQPEATIVLTCTSAGPDLIYTLVADDVTRTEYEIPAPGGARGDAGEGAAPVQPEPVVEVGGLPYAPVARMVEGGGSDGSYEFPLVEGAAFDATVVVSGEVVGQLQGVATCVEPEPQPEATTTTTAAPLVPTTAPPAPVVEAVAAVPGAPAPAMTELPRTGLATYRMALTGVALLVGGWRMVVISRRNRGEQLFGEGDTPGDEGMAR